MADYHLRPAEHADESLIFESYRLTVGPYIAEAWGWDETYQRKGFWTELPLAGFRIIETGNLFAGALHVVEDDVALHIRMIFLLPGFQRRGIGSALIRDIQEDGRRKGKAVELKVITCNPARHWYEQLGFQAGSERDSLLDMRWP